MTWNYAYTPAIWLPLGTILLFLSLATYIWHRRSVPGALPFTFALLFGALWAAGSALEYAAVDLAAKITWVKFQTAWQLPAVTAVTCFVLEYAWPGRWLTRRNLILLSIAPLFLVLATLTNDLHHLLWRGFSSWNGLVVPQLGSLGWMAIFYSFGLVFLTLIVLGWLFLHSPQHRWPVVIMIAGHIGVRTVFVLDNADLFRSALPLDVLGLAFISLMYAIALFGFRLFDPIPLARQSAIEQMRDGMLVLDPHRRVVSLNPAAEQILQMPAKLAKGRAIRDLLPAYPEGIPETPEETEIEFTLGVEQGQNGPPARYCTLAISQLKDWRGMEAGSLLLLRDVTSHKQAEDALNESREIQRLIYEKSFDGISIYEELPDEDRRILVDCNERYCQMAGRSKAELLAIGDTRVIQRSEQYTEETDRAAVLTEQAFWGVFSWIRPDGKQNIIEYNAAPIKVGERFYTIGVDRDVTDSRQTQAQILEQQRALAMLQEREHLARELHDGIGQVLGYVKMQARAARDRLAQGQNEAADSQLAQLEAVAQDAHANVREYILGAKIRESTPLGFLPNLRWYLQRFSEQYLLRTELIAPPDWNDEALEATAAAQLLRIIQESLSNARKHSQAQHVQVRLEVEDSRARVVVEDNGVGFDPDSLKKGQPDHYGLRFMRERAEQIGGHLQVQSASGKGTRVEVEVPVKKDAGKNRPGDAETR